MANSSLLWGIVLLQILFIASSQIWISNPLVNGDDGNSRLQEEIGHGSRVRFDKREADLNRGGPGVIMKKAQDSSSIGHGISFLKKRSTGLEKRDVMRGVMMRKREVHHEDYKRDANRGVMMGKREARHNKREAERGVMMLNENEDKQRKRREIGHGLRILDDNAAKEEIVVPENENRGKFFAA
ncbi:hypothetical protein ACHWQZ_G015074 [Mnemiopsis leidyi]